MRFAKHDHVVETFAADRADESLNASILPGRSRCARMVPNAHCPDPLQEDWTIRGVSIPNKISRRVVPRERLGDLARDPLRGWVCRHAKRHPKPSSVAHNDKTIQNFEGDRRQDKEVDRRDAVDVIAEKRPPALRRWPRVAAHVPSDRRLGDLEAELEQLTMNTRRAPKCVRTAHLANERGCLWMVRACGYAIDGRCVRRGTMPGWQHPSQRNQEPRRELTTMSGSLGTCRLRRFPIITP